MTLPNHDDWRELTGVYALGVLTGDDKRRFEAHLMACSECAAEVSSFRSVTEALSFAVPEREPTPGLRERVLSSTALSGAGAPIPFGRRDAKQIAGPRSDRSRWLQAAAIFLIVALGAAAFNLRNRIQTLEARLDEALERNAAMDRQLADLRRTASEARSTAAILAAPDLARIELAGQPVAPDARARAFWSRTRGLVFTASDLPALPPGKVYQLWVVTASAPISAGVLVPDQTGRMAAVIQTPEDLPTPLAMAVTIEPAGGVPAPTGERYLVGTPAAL